MTTGGEKTIRGVIIPTAWDQEGRIVTVGISANDEEEYLLERGPLASELIGLVQQEVEVRGRVTQPADGTKRIQVQSYRLTRRGEQDEVA
ncbi:MAG: hypothetical protein HY910_06715 [Desulfarculus sp.]|nr:hypothetical protein [Desulfarculus sp.]